MGLISALFAHKVVDVAIAGRPDGESLRRTLLQSVNIDPDLPVDPARMVVAPAYYKLCENVVRQDPHGASVPLRVGGSMRCDDYGAFGLAWKTALTLRGSYARAERYGKVLTSVSTHELVRDSGRWFMTLHRAGERKLGMRLSNEQTIAAIASLSSEVCSQAFRPDAVYFRHASPGDDSAHAAYFGCPVYFNADRDALEVSEQMLEQSTLLGDAGVSQFFDSHLERELARHSDDEGLARRVSICVAQSLSEGVPLISDVARQLGMSGRTLQRRLAEQGVVYQEQVVAARRTLAERLLRDSDYSLADIAFLTGFADQSSFTRAFKRWGGHTPRSFRLAATAVDGS